MAPQPDPADQSGWGSSASIPPSGVIHDLGYRGYSGPRLGVPAIAWALVLSGLRSVFGLGRSGKSKVLPFVLLGINTIPALIMVGVLVMLQTLQVNELPVSYARYASTTQVLACIFAAAQAPVLFSADQRSGAIALYLARPASSAIYALSRFASMVLALLLFLWTPIVVLWLGAILANLDFTEATTDAAIALLLTSLLAVGVAGVTSLIAASSTRRGFAVVGSIGVLLVLDGIVSIIQGISTSSSNYRLAEWVGLLSPYSLYRGVCAIVEAEPFTPKPTGQPIEALYFIALLGLGAAAIALLLLRYRKVASR